MNVRVLILLLLLGTCACSKQDSEDVTLQPKLTFWHMWSEPHQAKVIDSLVHLFELNNNVDVEVTLLSWANAKQKIDLAINAGNAPDVLHSSIDWVQEYRLAGVIEPVLINKKQTVLPVVLSACSDENGMVFGYPWSVNTRCLVFNSQTNSSIESWQDFTASDLSIGLPTYEPYNVSKKVLPIVWAFDAEFMATFPYSESISLATKRAFEQLRRLGTTSVVKPSRELDVDVLNGGIDATITGAWILEMAKDRRPQVELTIDGEMLPSETNEESPPSMLGGDCLLIPTSSRVAKEQTKANIAHKLAQFLTSESVVRAMITSLPEVGLLPYVVLNSSQAVAFDKQLSNTRTLVWSATFNEALATVEKSLVRVYLSDDSIDEIIESLKRDLITLES